MIRTEQELAHIIVEWLKLNGWEVYQEVQFGSYGSVADIVALKDKKIWVIETKLAFGLNVIEQAYNWRGFANYISVATLYPKKSSFKCLLCEKLNLGVLYVMHHYNCCKQPNIDGYYVEEKIKIVEQSLEHEYLLNCLQEKHKTFASAGNNEGKRLTPFSNTVDELEKYAIAHPGCLLKEACGVITLHYRNKKTGMNCLSSYIDRGIIKNIRKERTKEGIRIYYKND